MSINPYEAPPEPEPLPQLGVKYLVDRRKLTLAEHCQLTQYPLKGFWAWLTLRLGLDRDPTYVHAVQRAAEMVAEPADMPPQVAELLLEMQAFAETCGFNGRWTSMTVNSEGYPNACLLRMLSRDPRTYLEMAFLAVDRLYISRHNLVSATVTGDYIVTSNGFANGKRAPEVKPKYYKSLPFDHLLQIHLQRINTHPQPFREVQTWEDMTKIVQEIVDGYIEFQIARGYYTPLAEENQGQA